MRELTADLFISLDGFASGLNEAPFFGYFGDELDKWIRKHVVLEREPAVANAWRKQRWDSFTLVTPNFQVRMPGAEYDGNEPYGFMPLSEIVRYFDDYVARFGLPVRCGVECLGWKE